MPLPKRPVQGLYDLNQQRRDRETLNQVLDHSYDDSKRVQDAEKAAGVTVVNTAYPAGIEIDCRRYNQKGDGVSDDASAISNACLVATELGGATIRLYGTPNIGAAISVPTNTVIKGDGREVTTCTKVANIDMFTLAAGAELRGLAIDGDGANFTGRGVVCSSGFHQKVVDCEILDMEGPCVEFTAATIGTYSHIDRCHFGRTDPADAAIVLPDDGSTASPRYITECTTVAFQILVDCGAAQNTLVRGNYFNNMDFGTSKKTIVVGNRIATTGGSLDISGEDNVVVGNAIAGAPTLVSGAARCVVQGNVAVNNTVDNSGSTGSNANWCEIFTTSYTPAFTASGTAPDLGNGTLTGLYWRQGRTITAKVVFTAGSTTTFGTGTLRFGLPFTVLAGITPEGPCRVLDSGTNFRIGVALANSATAYATILVDSAASEATATVPITFTTNDSINFTVSYQL